MQSYESGHLAGPEISPQTASETIIFSTLNTQFELLNRAPLRKSLPAKLAVHPHTPVGAVMNGRSRLGVQQLGGWKHFNCTHAPHTGYCATLSLSKRVTIQEICKVAFPTCTTAPESESDGRQVGLPPCIRSVFLIGNPSRCVTEQNALVLFKIRSSMRNLAPLW